MKVYKYKGSVLADAKALPEISNNISNSPEPCVVVVSALKGVVPKLRALFSTALRKGNGFEPDLRALEEEHSALARRLLSGQRLDDYLAQMRQQLDELREILNSVGVMKDGEHPMKDYILSKGDLLASLLFYRLFENASWCDSRNFIVTNNNFGAPEIEWEESCRAARRVLGESAKITVVPGYCGKTREGYTISLGKVGLSLTASVVAAAYQ